MRITKIFTANQKVSDAIEETSNNNLHKVDSLLFAYVNSARPDRESLAVIVTDREHAILRVALKERQSYADTSGKNSLTRRCTRTK